MIKDVIRSILGVPPQAPAVGGQWQYGDILEYTIAAIAFLFILFLTYKCFFVVFGKIFGGRRRIK